MIENEHFVAVETWEAAERTLGFRPLRPTHTLGCGLGGLRIHVRDHKRRELPPSDRSLEAHFGRFVVAQSRKGEREARRWALDVAYGPDARPATVGRHEGRSYALGPDLAADEVDGRSPAVVTWHDGDMFYLVASAELEADELLAIAESMYEMRP